MFVCLKVQELKMDTPLFQFRMTNFLYLIPVFSRSVVLRISHRGAGAKRTSSTDETSLEMRESKRKREGYIEMEVEREKK